MDSPARRFAGFPAPGATRRQSPAGGFCETRGPGARRPDCRAGAHRGRIEFGHLPMAWGDPSLLRIALQNLVANGLKFVAKGQAPVVGITARTEGEQAPDFGARQWHWHGQRADGQDF